MFSIIMNDLNQQRIHLSYGISEGTDIISEKADYYDLDITR